MFERDLLPQWLDRFCWHYLGITLTAELNSAHWQFVTFEWCIFHRVTIGLTVRTTKMSDEVVKALWNEHVRSINEQ